MKVSYGRVAFFEDFGHCKMRFFFGAVLGGSWAGFWELFGRFLMNFGGIQRVEEACETK